MLLGILDVIQHLVCPNDAWKEKSLIWSPYFVTKYRAIAANIKWHQ